MKRNLAVLLVITLSIFILTSCGQGGKPAANSDAAKPAAGESTQNTGGTDTGSTETNSGAANSNGIYKEKGSELTDFTSAILDSEKAFEEPINKLSNVSMDAMMDRVLTNMAILSMPQYDILSLEDEAVEKGKLMLAGFDAVREKSGNTIKFTASNVYAEDDQMGNKKGDKYSEQGSLDISKNTLSYESKTERGGKVISRTVFEANVLKDGTYIIQYLYVSQSMREGDPANSTAVFKRYNKDNYKAVTADFEADTGFAYESIIGKDGIQPEDWAKKYKVNGKFTVANGNATFEK